MRNCKDGFSSSSVDVKLYSHVPGNVTLFVYKFYYNQATNLAFHSSEKSKDKLSII